MLLSFNNLTINFLRLKNCYLPVACRHVTSVLDEESKVYFGCITGTMLKIINSILLHN